MATCGGTDALAMRLILSYDGQNDDTYARTMLEFLRCPERCCSVITSMLPVLVSLLEECRPEWRDEMIDELAQVLDRQSEITFNISREASDD
jgi:hypothetical protein